MSMIDGSAEHEAMNRLFELVRNGDTDSTEFAQLDSLIYERLQQTYRVTGADPVQQRSVVAG